LPFNGPEHFTYPEAIRYLARKYNIEIEETELTDAEKSKYRSKESMYLVSDCLKYFTISIRYKKKIKQLGLSLKL
jgi:DNA primase